MSYVQRVFYVGQAPEAVNSVAEGETTLQWIQYDGATGNAPDLATAPVSLDIANVGTVRVRDMFTEAGHRYAKGEPLEPTGLMRVYVNTAASLAQGAVATGGAATAAWYWKLDETSGVIATATLGGEDLSYGQDAATYDYSVAPLNTTPIAVGKDFDVAVLSRAKQTTLHNGGYVAGRLGDNFTIEFACRTLRQFDQGAWSWYWMSRYINPGARDWALVANGTAGLLMYITHTQPSTVVSTFDLIPTFAGAGISETSGWHWVSICMDRNTNLLTCLVDGVTQSSIDISTVGITPQLTDAAANAFTIGNHPTSVSNNTAHMTFSDVAIYNTALSDTVRLTHLTAWQAYEASSWVSPPAGVLLAANPSWYYRLDEVAGVVATNLAATGEDLSYAQDASVYGYTHYEPPASIGSAKQFLADKPLGGGATPALSTAIRQTVVDASGGWGVGRLGDNFTIEFAFKRSYSSASSQGVWLSKGTASGGYDWRVFVFNGGVLQLDMAFTVGVSKTYVTLVPAPLMDTLYNETTGPHWCSIVMDRASNTLTCRIDNVTTSTIDISTWGNTPLFTDSSAGGLTIGGNTAGGDTLPGMRGAMDEVALHNTALNSAERTANFNGWAQQTGGYAPAVFSLGTVDVNPYFNLVGAARYSYRGPAQLRQNFRTADLAYTGRVSDYAVGVPPPVVPPILAVSGAVPVGTLDADTRYYLMTYVNDMGYESAPGPVTLDPIHVGPDTAVQILAPLYSDVAYHPVPYGSTRVQDYVPIVSARFYRTNTGTTETAYQFITEVLLGTSTVLVDDVDNASLGEILVTDSWDVPPEEVTAGCKMANGTYILVHEYKVHMSIPGVMYAFPVLYTQLVKDKLLHVETVGTVAIALSEGGPYLIAGGSPDAMEVVKLPFYQACQSVRAVSVYLDMLIYPAQDGLIGVSAAGQVVNLTEGLYEEAQWRDRYVLSTLFSVVYDGVYYAWQTGGSGFAFDLKNRTIQPTSLTLFNDTPYSAMLGAPEGVTYDGANDTLYLSDNSGGAMYQWRPADPTLYQDGYGGVVPWAWVSKEFYIPDRSYGAVKITGLVDISNRIKFELIVDGNAVPLFTMSTGQPAGVVISEDVYRLPAVRGSKLKIRISTYSGAPEVHTMQVSVHPNEII